MILLNTFSNVFLSSELDWLWQKVILASVNSQRMLWRYSYELFPKHINYLFRCVFQFWIGLTVSKSFPCICQFSHIEHSTQLFTLFIEYLFRCAFQFWYVLSLAKSYPCNCHFSLHVVTNTLREPCRTNIAVFFQLLSNVQETCCKFVNVCKLK